MVVSANSKKDNQLFTSWQWATIVGGLVVAGVSVTAWSFQTFIPRVEFIDTMTAIDQRLQRIENKLDNIIERTRR